MSAQQRMVVAGLSAGAAAAIAGTVANGIAAAGTTQGSATALGADVNFVSTVAASSGVALPAMNPGDEFLVFNAGANALKLYPPSGGQINALGANNAYSIATATPCCWVTCVSPTQYVAAQSA